MKDAERPCSLPLDRGRRLAGDVIHHTVDATHLIDYAIRDPPEQIVRQVRMELEDVLRILRR